MSSLGDQLVVLLALLGLLCRSAMAIRCYQCISIDNKHPFQCNEFLDDADLQPESCEAVYGAQYCVKQNGRFEGGLGTKRFCSALDLGNYCNYIQQPGDELEYRSCVYTCSSDGCNAATLPTPQLVSLLGAVLIACARTLS